MLDSTEEFIFF